MASHTQLGLIIFEFSRKSQTKLSTQKLHSFVTKSKLARDPFFATQLVRFYALNDDLVSARKLFDVFPERSVFLWNSVIRAFAKAHQFSTAFSLFSQMLSSATRPDNFTYACLARGCSESFDTEGLRCIHGIAIVSGLGFDQICGSAIVKAYSKAGLTFEASKLFLSIPDPDVALWNAMISGYGCSGFWDKGVNLFNLMQHRGHVPNCYTMVALTTCLIDPSSLLIARSVHGFCLKINLDTHAYVGCALVNLYSRCRCIASACSVYNTISGPDLVACSSLITGYSRCGNHKEALYLFNEMRMSGKKPDCVLVAIVLGSCAELSDSVYGKEVHGYVIRLGLEFDIKVCSALIDMYSKCGVLDYAMNLFAGIPEKNIVSFNSVILGLGLHGFASSAFEKFTEMLEMGLKPDEVTFAALLSTCCHSGLLNEGQEIFERMKSEFGVEPQTEHYVYVVKLMGMAGKLEEAFEFVMSLRKPIDSGILGALLSYCEVHENTQLAEVVAENILENGEERRSVYKVMLSNVYARYGRWDDVERLRDGITESSEGKLPGISWF
ncbi:PREDICTED: putative pentatricopeptide repeat-containing protein At1g64310 [Camelina sativa]|uniref:Pentatricopeptide repeat-containing protein At1g64310 n=1 Tax=Camelina sativa TaxID=90675 RepID=A0ABM0WQ82_CAMSA|nr:PREDICTED: putative pentatricopeptide repeat-containing protein At1g64310 [Camelina sativa]